MGKNNDKKWEVKLLVETYINLLKYARKNILNNKLYELFVLLNLKIVEFKNTHILYCLKITYLTLSPPGSFLIQFNNPIIPFVGSFSPTRMIFWLIDASSAFNNFCNIGNQENSELDILTTIGTMFCSKGYSSLYNNKLYFILICYC